MSRRRLTAREQRRVKQEADELSDAYELRLHWWDRFQLIAYLKCNGFEVYDHEDTEDLREAVRLNMETEGEELPW